VEAIKAVWTNGRIQPLEPVNWPEGSKLVVEPVAWNGDDIVPGDNVWGDDPESFVAWAAAVERIEPMVWAEGEREQFEAYREKVRQYTLDAVRKQMAEIPRGDLS
jgi:hypothetical protein